MTALKRRIVDLVRALGPMTVADYMALCLSDPQHGYYMTREPFGREGDFTTAPEISQMFGELIGVWLVAAWQACGAPERPVFAEIGPGRGTLARDIARSMDRIAPRLRDASRFALIETSPALRAVQMATLRNMGRRLDWFGSIGELPPGPLFIVGNELFDAIPMRQYVRTDAGWRERCLDIDERGTLRLVAGAGSLDPALLPGGANDAPGGSVVELSPARSALMASIAQRIEGDGGAGLFIDYGYAAPAVGDTLQALRRHAFDDVLAHPGEADLTSHVDFSALAGAARSVGLDAHLMTQAQFLLGTGLLERAGILGANADQAGRDAISAAVERLAGADQMGTLFKALAIAPRGITVPPPFPQIDEMDQARQ